MKEKIVKLRNKMNEAGLDGFIVYNPANIEYLVNTKAEGFLIINDYENIFMTDARYIEDVRNKITIADEILIQDISQTAPEDFLSFFENCNKVGFEENYVTYAKYRTMIMKFRIKEPVEASSVIEKMRQIKDKDEIRYIETACNITDSCFMHLQNFIKVGMTEREVAFEIEKFFWENNAEGTAFDTIVASGANSSKPHAIPTDKKIEYGDNVLIDFGAKYNGYCADMTRTIFMGTISDIQRNAYNFVKGVQERALNKMKAGVSTKEIATYANKEFKSANLDLIHALGHGVGIDIHEQPFFSMRDSWQLECNMVVTDEPGLYLPGKFGIRIEDTLLVNNLEPTQLTKTNKNIIII